MKQRHIFAIGNNGFRKNPDNALLNRYILKQANVARPKVCVIPTASGDEQAYIDDFYSVFKKYDCELSCVSLFRGETEDLESLILAQDVLYITGGNTRNMLVLWKEWKLDQFIQKAYEKGVVLAGGSAGCLCWFQEGVTDSIPGRLTAMKCLGYLSGSVCPHYDGERNRRPSYHSLLETHELVAGYAVEDEVALHFVNETFQEAVCAHENKHAYRVELNSLGKAEETPIAARFLGK